MPSQEVAHLLHKSQRGPGGNLERRHANLHIIPQKDKKERMKKPASGQDSSRPRQSPQADARKHNDKPLMNMSSLVLNLFLGFSGVVRKIDAKVSNCSVVLQSSEICLGPKTRLNW